MKRSLLLLLSLSLIAVAPVAAQTPFYQGKTVQIRVGFAAGGAFDVVGAADCSVIWGNMCRAIRRLSCRT